MGWWGRCRKRKAAMYVCMYEYFSCMQMACNYLTCGSMFRPFLILMCTGPSVKWPNIRMNMLWKESPLFYILRADRWENLIESRKAWASCGTALLWAGGILGWELPTYVHMTTRNSAAFLPFCLEYYIQNIWKRDERASQHVSNLTTQAPFNSKTEKRLGNCVFC